MDNPEAKMRDHCDKCGAECPSGTVYLDGQNVCSTCYGWMRLAVDLAESLKHIQDVQEGKTDDLQAN
jgi:hypothetical protein